MNPLYLDHAATTPVRREVSEAMVVCLERHFGNPSSRHGWGRDARRALEDARDRVAASLGCSPRAVYFVRGGTEGDNLAVLGRARRVRRDGEQPRVVTTAVEHPAVLGAAAQVVREGGVHEVVGFGPEGLDMDALRRTLAEGASLVSCMWVNNELGLLLPVEAVAEACMEHGVPLHSDAVQAAGKVPIHAGDVPVDLLVLTGHKIYGPKGTGVLVARDPDLVEPLHFGGGQERAVRPGTEDVAGALGFATALELAVREQPDEAERLTALRQDLEARFLAWNPRLRINGGRLPRAPHILSLGLEGVDTDALLAVLDQDGIAVSAGSACASGSSKPSPTVTALYGEGDDRPSLRLSLGRLVTSDDVERVVAGVSGAYEQVRTLFGLMSRAQRKILVAMSGGVDSSVAAALLVEAGHEVIGATMKTFCYQDNEGPGKTCCGLDGIMDARRVADRLGIPHHVFDVEDEFTRDVIDDFVHEYSEGRTPNPCVRCNSNTKFRDLLRRGALLGCDGVASGHYVRTMETEQGPALLRGRDPRKDQSYFLWGLPADLLARVHFPLGELTKPEVRARAKALGLVTADKPESQEICFVPSGRYRDFLEGRLLPTHRSLSAGPIVHVDGRVLGSHDGYAGFTVGQRKGLGGGFSEPLYVVEIRPESRAVVVGPAASMTAAGAEVGDLNWLGPVPEPGDRVQAQIRYRAAAVPCVVEEAGPGLVRIAFPLGARAVTPGQSAVFFEGDRVLGGGRIRRSLLREMASSGS